MVWFGMVTIHNMRAIYSRLQAGNVAAAALNSSQALQDEHPPDAPYKNGITYSI